MIDLMIQETIETAKVLLTEARDLYEKSMYDQSEESVYKALKLLNPHADRDDLGEELDVQSQKHALLEGIAHAYNRLNVISMSQADFEQSLQHAQTSLLFCRRIGNLSREAGVLGNIGGIYRSLSDYSQSLEYLQKGLALNEKLGEKAGIAHALNNIGLSYGHLSDYAKELEYYTRALAINEELGNKGSIARNFINIGVLYWNLSNSEKALEYYQKALSIEVELNRKTGIAQCLGNIGTVYYTLADNDNAIRYFYKALAINEEIGRKEGIATVLGNIGEFYKSLAEYNKALEYFRKSLAICEDLSGKMSIAVNLGRIGDTFATTSFELYNSREAEKYLLKALVLCEEIGAKSQSFECHKRLAKLYKIEERWRDFATHLEKYYTLKEEVQSEEATKQAHLMDHRRKIEESERDRQVKLARFQEQEKILHNILPANIAERIVLGEKTIADSHQSVSVFFSDIVGFTKLSQKISAEELVGMLNGIFTQFDQLARKHGLEKIKTIGDSYMAVCGAPIQVDNHAERAALFALEVAELMKDYSTDAGDKISIRIGLHSGSVVAGVIGENKFAYDMWGDAVNTAARMESHGEAGRIHVSGDFVQKLSAAVIPAKAGIHFSERGEMEIKGKGMMTTYFLERA